MRNSRFKEQRETRGFSGNPVFRGRGTRGKEASRRAWRRLTYRGTVAGLPTGLLGTLVLLWLSSIVQMLGRASAFFTWDRLPS
jgi:hypothetical protein